MASGRSGRGALLRSYVDTSVLVSALTNEADSGLSLKWLGEQEASDLSISDWTVTEFASALSAKRRAQSLGDGHRAAALAAFARLSEESFTVLPVIREDFRVAARFTDQATLGLRAGDALHVAICSRNGVTLCTLDRVLAGAAPRLGVEALLISAPRRRRS
jgi:uncharacterized protein